MSTNHRETLCILHGWGLNGRVLGKFMEGFVPDWHVRFLVLPGYDGTAPAALGMEKIARSLAPQIPDHSVLMGWSLGGMIGIRIASMKPLRKLILLASTPCFVEKQDWPYGMKAEVIAGLMRQVKENSGKALHKFALLSSRGDEHPRATYRTLAMLLKQAAVHTDALLDGLEILQASDLRKEFSGLQCPAGAVLAENDALVSAAGTGAMRSLCPGLELRLVAGCGHAPFLSRPERIRHLLFTLLSPAPVT
ncbi:MAG: alpha/beta fold hydrolase [Gammaproteobacteria bacterium]